MFDLTERKLQQASLIAFLIFGVVTIIAHATTAPKTTQMASQLAVSIWGFDPEDTEARRRSRLTNNLIKLVGAGGMIITLIMSLSSRFIGSEACISAGCAVFAVWVSFILLYGYLVPRPATKRNKDENSDTKSNFAIKPKAGEKRLPVTIITGYLGSGKTTLVKHILSNTSGMRVLVIENEVGEAGIDHELLLQYAGKEDIVLLNNGCICCKVRGDVIRTFRGVVEKNLISALHWVIIETTGLADPAPLIQSLLVDEICKKHFVLDSVLAVVDAKHLPRHLPNAVLSLSSSQTPPPSSSSSSRGVSPSDAMGYEAVRQIAFADKVLINKIDLVGANERDRIVELVKNINPDAECIQSLYSKVSLSNILDVKMHEDSELSTVRRVTKRVEPSQDSQSHHTGPLKQSKGFSFIPMDDKGRLDLMQKGRSSSSSGAHSTEENISTVSLTLPMKEPLDINNVNLWLVQLLERDGENIYRCKGILNIHDRDEKFVFHGVHMIINGERNLSWKTDEVRFSRIVFIGRNLNAAELERGFLACRAHIK